MPAAHNHNSQWSTARRKLKVVLGRATSRDAYVLAVLVQTHSGHSRVMPARYHHVQHVAITDHAEQQSSIGIGSATATATGLFFTTGSRGPASERRGVFFLRTGGRYSERMHRFFTPKLRTAQRERKKKRDDGCELRQRPFPASMGPEAHRRLAQAQPAMGQRGHRGGPL